MSDRHSDRDRPDPGNGADDRRNDAGEFRKGAYMVNDPDRHVPVDPNLFGPVASSDERAPAADE